MARRSCTLFLLIVALCSCRREAGDSGRVVFWTPTTPPTQTERVVVWTSTAVPTYTKIVQIVTETPSPEYLCVTAIETVHLRPSPSVDNYPVTVLENGARLTDLGGRKEDFAFVSYGELSGWVRLKYVENCE